MDFLTIENQVKYEIAKSFLPNHGVKKQKEVVL